MSTSADVLSSVANPTPQSQTTSGSSLDVLKQVASGQTEQTTPPPAQPLTDDETKELQNLNASRSPIRKMLGLPSPEPRARELEAKMEKFHTEALAKSELMRQQVTDKAIGGAVATAPVTVPLAVNTAGAAAIPIARATGTAVGTAVRIARTPLGQAILSRTLEGATAGAGYALAKKWLGL